MIGYWADFINPFSGQPHLHPYKESNLYETDERFRCLGFKIIHRNNCKLIVHDSNNKNFIGKCAKLSFICKIAYRITNIFFLIKCLQTHALYVTGSLYTTAPARTEFLKEILQDCELVNVNEVE